MTENALLLQNNVLYAPILSRDREEENVILTRFCGIVCLDKPTLFRLILAPSSRPRIVYLTGNLSEFDDVLNNNDNNNNNNCLFCVVKEYSTNYETLASHVRLVDAGLVPINFFNVGVFFRRFFSPQKNYFNAIEAEVSVQFFSLLSLSVSRSDFLEACLVLELCSQHEFQLLTESNKAGIALRKGIYLTNVEKLDDCGEHRAFRLLRCSSNLEGPTDNLRATDREIIGDVNQIARFFFEQPVELNHVLAQIYYNHRNDNDTERKATIKRYDCTFTLSYLCMPVHSIIKCSRQP
jgi:hypothetical protein